VFRGFSLLRSVKSTKIIYAYYARNTNNACLVCKMCANRGKLEVLVVVLGKYAKKEKWREGEKGKCSIWDVCNDNSCFAFVVTAFLG